MRSKKRGALLIELSDHLLKLVQKVEESPQKTILYLDVVECATQDEKTLSDQLSRLLEKLPKVPAPFFASLPRSLITTRTLLLPSSQPQELASMVEFQIEKEIPFPKEKMIFDYQLIETTSEGYSRLLLAIAGEEVIHRYLAVLKGGKIVPASLFLSSQGLVSFFNFLQGEKEKKEIVSALIDVDLFVTHVEMIHEGRLYFTRSIPIGSRPIKEKGDSLIRGAFLQELHHTFAAFRKEFSATRTVDKIFLSGASEASSAIREAVSSYFSCPTEIIDLRNNPSFELRFGKGVLEEKLSFSSGIGFVLKDEKRMNLMPLSEKKAHATLLFRRSVGQSVALLVGSLLLVGLLFGNILHQRRVFFRSLEEKLQKIEPAASKMEVMQREIMLLKGREEESRMILEVLRELHRVMPQDASLTYLVITPGQLSLRGNSKNFSTVFQFVKALESSLFFESVKPKSATRRILPDGEVTLFQIDASVVYPKEKS